MAGVLNGLPNREPDSLVAGDSIGFQRFFPAYPASNGWFLDYEIRGQGQATNFQSVPGPDGQSHQVIVPAATTALYAVGDSVLGGYAVNEGNNTPSGAPERHQIYYQDFPIRQNLQGAQPDAPVLTFNQQMIANIKAVMLGKANADLLESRIGDTLFKYLTPKQLREELEIWKMKRRVEIDVQRAKNGKPSRHRMRPIASIMKPGPLWGTEFPFGTIGGI